MPSDTVKALPLVYYNSAGLTTNFAPLNVTPFPQPIFYVHIHNASNKNVIISFDGINDADFIFQDNEYLFYSYFGQISNNRKALIPANSQIWIREQVAGAGVGTIYFAAFYL